MKQQEFKKTIKKINNSCFVSLFVIKLIWVKIMLDYIYGKVSDVYPSYIVIETYGVGFKVNTPNPYSFELDSTIKVYLYNYITNCSGRVQGGKTGAAVRGQGQKGV